MGSWKRFLIIYFYCYLFNLAVLQKKHLDQYQTHVRRGLSRISPEVITITIMTFDFSRCVMPQWLKFFHMKILLFILNLSSCSNSMKIWRQANFSLMKMEHWWQWRLVSTHHIVLFLTLSLPNVAKGKIREKIPNFISWNLERQVAPCVSTGREVSFEWSLHRVSSTDSKVRATLQNSIIHSGSERVKQHCHQYLVLLEY